jgi:hypothetical protein
LKALGLLGLAGVPAEEGREAEEDYAPSGEVRRALEQAVISRSALMPVNASTSAR